MQILSFLPLKTTASQAFKYRSTLWAFSDRSDISEGMTGDPTPG